ncbi:MAG: hypothetical protein H7840_10310 [Alphaproteobacteria bacterium]
MNDMFLGMLEPHTYTGADAGAPGMVRDYGLPVPLGLFAIPEFMQTDCDASEIQEAIVSHLRPFIIEASRGNDGDASLGAFMNFDTHGAHIFFRQIYVGGTEYPSMALLRESGDLARMAAPVSAKLHALVAAFGDAVTRATAAARDGVAWLPESLARYATFYDDDSYRDWRDVFWFAFEHNDALVAWLEKRPFAKRATWCRHPCNTALVIAVEDQGDADAIAATWGGDTSAENP